MAGGALRGGHVSLCRGAIAMTVLPPAFGFVGKLLILDAARSADLMWWGSGRTIFAGRLIAGPLVSLGLAAHFLESAQRAEKRCRGRLLPRPAAH